MGWPAWPSYAANRIWRECLETGEVKFYKNRYESEPEVDMKEFFLVKIAALPMRIDHERF